jgi:hypothetical protein
MAGAFFPQAYLQMPEEKVGEHGGEHMMMPPRIFADFILVHAQATTKGGMKAVQFVQKAFDIAGIKRKLGDSEAVPCGATRWQHPLPSLLLTDGPDAEYMPKRLMSTRN